MATKLCGFALGIQLIACAAQSGGRVDDAKKAPIRAGKPMPSAAVTSSPREELAFLQTPLEAAIPSVALPKAEAFSVRAKNQRYATIA